MAETRIVTACLIIIGNEILSGRKVDANLPYIATRLNEKGVRLAEARIVPDIEAEIVDAVTVCRARHDYVLTTGGIGPTHDDITAASVAKAFGLAHTYHPEAKRLLESFYGERVTEARMRMAMMPEGAALVANPVSVAPGFRVENVYVLAGVPKIMQAMLDDILPELVGGAPVLARTVTVYAPESEMAAVLGRIEADHPGIEVGSYPFFRMEKPGTAVVVRGTEQAVIDAAVAQLRQHAAQHGIEAIDGQV